MKIQMRIAAFIAAVFCSVAVNSMPVSDDVSNEDVRKKETSCTFSYAGQSAVLVLHQETNFIGELQSFLDSCTVSEEGLNLSFLKFSVEGDVDTINKQIMLSLDFLRQRMESVVSEDKLETAVQALPKLTTFTVLCSLTGLDFSNAIFEFLQVFENVLTRFPNVPQMGDLFSSFVCGYGKQFSMNWNQRNEDEHCAAISLLERASALSVENDKQVKQMLSITCFNYGLSLVKAERLSDGHAQLKKATVLFPTHSAICKEYHVATILLAQKLFEAKDFKGAQELLEEALECHSEKQDLVRKNLIELCIHRATQENSDNNQMSEGKLLNIVDLLKKAYQLDSTYEKTQQQYACALAQLGGLYASGNVVGKGKQEAIQLFHKALEIAPSLHQIRLLLERVG